MALKAIRILLLFLLCAVLQTTLCHTLAIRGARPDLILLFTVWVAMKEGAFAGTIIGFLSGLFFDVYAPQNLGSGALANCVIGFLTGLLDERTLKIDPRYRVVIILLAALLHDAIVTLRLHEAATLVSAPFLLHVLPAALYTTLVGGVLLIFESRRQG